MSGPCCAVNWRSRAAAASVTATLLTMVVTASSIFSPPIRHAARDARRRAELVLGDLAGANGLCFSPDEKVLYIVEGRHQPHRVVWAYDVGPGGRLSGKRLHIDAGGPGALDGIKCDEFGNLWCGWGSNGAVGANPADLDGVMVFNPEGKAIGHIRLPERCANLCFGGAKNNRLFMASSHSIYALYVEARGAV